eukprot:CAMPEP_0202857368 /NCGR_PEP_ID=MMETSP1391-20130828/338_2 /ASSEMBLY_ACC=CAM_ASM_000867 /TAXON_ID=1034604 /ORGANISM="Chlamydomonas leiostraca, Strain SAG 11-49" /LENGTH=79 /DNA_ID=CAMNT_0049536157 /DNA_START=278 /DNA_END=517 /DNA_ORIENTATION=-
MCPLHHALGANAAAWSLAQSAMVYLGCQMAARVGDVSFTMGFGPCLTPDMMSTVSFVASAMAGGVPTLPSICTHASGCM